MINLPLPHQFTLFALDNHKGTFMTSGPYFSQPFYAASLIELTHLGCIVWENDKVSCIKEPEKNDRVLPWMYQWLKDQEGRKVSTVYSDLAFKSDELTQLTLRDLLDWEILKEEKQKVLWVFNTTSYPELQGIHENLIKARLKKTLNGIQEPSFNDLALLKLLSSAKLLGELESEQLKTKKLKYRIDQLAKENKLGETESKLLNQVDEEIINFFVFVNVIT
jgi:hypothetical protein